jgi:hypothetical protein
MDMAATMKTTKGQVGMTESKTTNEIALPKTGKEPFRLLTFLTYADDPVEFSPVHTGTLEECQKLMEKIPAVASSAGGQLIDAMLGIVDDDQFQLLTSRADDRI